MIKLLTVIFQFATSWIGRGSRIEDKLEEISKRIDEVELQELRNRFIQLVYHTPNETMLINATFDEYKALGGDSWVDDVYDKWLAKQHKNKL